jgi:cobalt-zinc-cadmium efflux system protein
VGRRSVRLKRRTAAVESGSHEPLKSQGHDAARDVDRRYLHLALALIGSFMIFEVIVAVISGSVALFADAGHMLTDVGAIAGAIWVTSLTTRPASQAYTFGLKRAEVLSAAINGTTLLIVAALVTFEAIQRLISRPPVQGGAMIVVAIVGVGVNSVATLVLSRANQESMNIRGAFLHILTDLYAFIATAVAGALIVTMHWSWADPVASLVVAVLMFRAASSLLQTSGRVLLQGTPESVDLRSVRDHMIDLPDVVEVHELHAWTLSSDLPVLSAHVVVKDECINEGRMGEVLDHLQGCLADHFDVEHSTFQLEKPLHREHEWPGH